MGLGIGIPPQQRPHNVVILPSIRWSAITILRWDEWQWYNRLQCLDDKDKHEINKKLKTIKHIHDANLPKNLFILDIFSNEMLRFNKLLFHCNFRQQQKDTNRF